MNIIRKPWGREEWLILNDKYCLKRLYIDAGKRLSLQFHEIKKETMILEDGTCDLLKNGETILMKYGEPYTINPRDVHRLHAHRDTIILEVSTPEVDDVVRVEDDYGRPQYSRRKEDKKSQIEGENT
jgi:mannose-6-phosphate isomerase-like protein (cupin superfamily)